MIPYSKLLVLFTILYSTSASNKDDMFDYSKQSYMRMFFENDYKVTHQLNAERMRQFLDSSADPCEDFYTFACGNYAQYMPRNGEYFINDLEFQELMMKEVLKPYIRGPPANEAERRMKVFMDKCTAFKPEQENKSVIATKFLSVLEQNLTDWTTTLFEWNAYGLPVLSTFLTEDLVPLPVVTWNVTSMDEYVEVARGVYGYFDLEDQFDEVHAKCSYNLEQKLYFIDELSYEDEEDVFDMKSVVSLVEERAPNFSLDSITIHSKLAKLLTEQEPFILKATLQLHVLAKLKDVIESFEESKSKRLDQCYDYAATYFRLGLVSVFDKLWGARDEQSDRSIIIESIRRELTKQVTDCSWMDERTKEEALKKINAVTFQLSVNKFLQNETRLTEYLSDVVVDSGTFLEVFFNVRYNNFWKQLRNKDIPIDEEYRADHLKHEVYSNEHGQIIIPLVLQVLPLYDPYALLYTNYGGFGTVVGRELLQIFGRFLNYNSEGEYREWWTAKSSEALVLRMECFIRQYQELTYFAEEMRDEAIISHIPESLGLLTTYRAYESIKGQYSSDYVEDYAALNMSMDQIFFLSFTQKYCTNMPLFDPISEVRGAVMNLPEFSDAFNCPEDTPMNPSDKCQFF